MTINEFLHHWSIAENPFQGEEARADAVFGRLTSREGDPRAKPEAGLPPIWNAVPYHGDFEKVLGDLRRPSSAIVFGEKGSGKTAMRLQIAARVREFNAANPTARVLLVPYDDLGPILGRFAERAGGKNTLEAFQKFRLSDHLDAILHSVTSRLTDAALEVSHEDEPIELGSEPKKTLRKLDRGSRRDLLVLQAIYDRPDEAPQRTRAMRRRLGLGIGPLAWSTAQRWFVALGPFAIFGYALWERLAHPPAVGAAPTPGFLPNLFDLRINWVLLVLSALYTLVLLRYLIADVFVPRQQGRRLRRQIRTVSRPFWSYARSIAQLDRAWRDPALLPVFDSEDARYALLARLRRALKKLGYASIVVLVDRVDEPSLVSGDMDRMRAVIWPMLNNKFLQQEGVGVKMLLPIELRHALMKESSAFFQEARLDKQNMIERLSWSGSMLYDLCNARLRACLRPPVLDAMSGGQGPAGVSLIDLFEQEVTRQELIDALDQMHQPRDAFKFLYRCITEHCANVSAEENSWRIPKLVLETVKRHEAERVQQLYRGIRPA